MARDTGQLCLGGQHRAWSPKQVKPQHLSAGAGADQEEMPTRESDMACEPEKESRVFKDQWRK